MLSIGFRFLCAIVLNADCPSFARLSALWSDRNDQMRGFGNRGKNDLGKCAAVEFERLNASRRERRKFVARARRAGDSDGAVRFGFGKGFAGIARTKDEDAASVFIAFVAIAVRYFISVRFRRSLTSTVSPASGTVRCSISRPAPTQPRRAQVAMCHQAVPDMARPVTRRRNCPQRSARCAGSGRGRSASPASR